MSKKRPCPLGVVSVFRLDKTYRLSAAFKRLTGN